MIKDDKIINTLMYGDMVQKLATMNNIDLHEARSMISNMSFSQYNSLIEANGAAIVPPSGNPITGNTSSATGSPQGTAGASQMKSIWPGKGSPVQQGMTVGLKGQNGLPIPGMVSQVDAASNGVKVKNPTTGKEEWQNTNDLEPFMANQGQQSQNIQPGTQPTTEESGLRRLRELAGIQVQENCSAGATGAGSIAVAPTSMGKLNKRQYTNEATPKEYTPDGPAKTIVGDTKPAQASGELSSNLAARGKKTASRINNGFKK